VMGSVVVSELEYGHPGGDSLFFDVSFGVGPGEHAALVGPNGVGKSTILRILTGALTADDGVATITGSMLSMTQDVGMAHPDDSLRDLLISVAPPQLRAAGQAMVAAEAALADGTDDGMGYAEALATWGDLGGYELETQWAAAVSRSIKSEVVDLATRKVRDLSGGERKRLVLDLLFASDAEVLLLDEPDNYLDVPTRMWLEEQINASSATILMVSHDRELLSRATTKVIAVEGSGAWVHGGSYATFDEARARRQEQLGDAVARWHAEERRLYRHMKIMKQRAAANFKNATKANGAETRWKKFADAGPPPPPAPEQRIVVGLRGADSARRVLRIEQLGVDGLVLPFSDEIMFGERIGLIGPNGTGKTHLLDVFAGRNPPDEGTVAFGPRTSVGMFTQVHERPDLKGRACLEIVTGHDLDLQRAMGVLGRYGLAEHAQQDFATLSGGQKARMEILGLELAGHNVLLLDEPTDNLDIDSADALERALDTFAGTVVAVSHDRTFLRTCERFILVTDDGEVLGLPDYDLAIAALTNPATAAGLPLARSLH
jgi:ATPase subunit of ABC transporter with duplicated ATPase domains